jgi:hypothetical protein
MLHDGWNFGRLAHGIVARHASKCSARPQPASNETVVWRSVEESLWFMGRISLLGAAVVCMASASGCGGLGWYRAAGELPGVAPTDYAFWTFCGVSSQLYPASPSQIESSAIEALGDLGFRIEEPPAHLPAGESTIRAKTEDGRPTTVTITPQNLLTKVRVEIGPIHFGDQELSRDLLRRISLNFGTINRAYTPIDTTLPKRINPSRFVPEGRRNPPAQLEGEGLRPNEDRDKAAGEQTAPEQEPTVPASALPAVLQGLLQGGGVQPGQNVPFVPFPFPTNDQDAP